MEHNSDKNLKNLLDKREISPSADSWSKLESMLDANQQKATKTKMWLFIAAAIFGALMLSTTYFFQNDDVEQIQVVEQNVQKNLIEENDFHLTPVTEVEQVVVNTEESKNSNVGSKAAVYQKKPIVKRLQKNQPQELVAEQKTIIVSPLNNEIATVVVPNSVVDDLLHKTVSQNQDNISIKVSAKSLLAEVDKEIESTFREKVIRTAAKNYQNIKVAVANRNYEEL